MSAPPPPVPVPGVYTLSPQLPDAASSLVLSDDAIDYAERIALEAKIRAVPEHTPVRPVVVVAKEVRDTAFGGAKDVDCFIWVDINGVAVVDASKRVYRTLAYNEIASWAVESDMFKMQVVGRKGKVKSKVYVVGYQWAVKLKKTLWVTVNLYLDSPDVVRELQDATPPLTEGSRVPDGPLELVEPFGATGFIDAMLASGKKTAAEALGQRAPNSPPPPIRAASAPAPNADAGEKAMANISEEGAKKALMDVKAKCAQLQAELQAERLRSKDLERLAASEGGREGSTDTLKTELASRDRELEHVRARIADLESKCEELREEAASAHVAAAEASEAGNGEAAAAAMRERMQTVEDERAKAAVQAESLMSMLEENQAMLDEQVAAAQRSEAEVAELRAALEAQRDARQLAEEARLAAENDASFRSESSVAAAAAAEAAAATMADRMNSTVQGLRGAQAELAKLREKNNQTRSEAEALATAVPAFAALFQRELNLFLASGAIMSLNDAISKYRRECKERKRLYNLLQELRGNIRVYCRVRPLSEREAIEEAEVIEEARATGGSRAAQLYASSAHNRAVGPIRFPGEDEISLIGERATKTYEFDRVFDPDCTQEDVFRDIAPLTSSVLDGYNVCVFAYGQTGSGKTHTMIGSSRDDPGVAQRALCKLFETATEREGDYELSMKASAFEIYLEAIRDLLAPAAARQPGAPPQQKLEVHMAPGGGTFVPGLTAESVSSAHDVELLMERAQGNRATFSTNMNEHSSRSHSVLSVSCYAKNKLTGVSSMGKLHIIDLAGSERVKQSEASGERLAEAMAINKSLSALGDVIASLAAKEKHVPYRNSRLTHVLQDSLGGNSKVLMVVNVSATTSCSSETGCSLTFAQRVRAVELGSARANTASASSSSTTSTSDGTAMAPSPAAAKDSRGPERPPSSTDRPRRPSSGRPSSARPLNHPPMR